MSLSQRLASIVSGLLFKPRFDSESLARVAMLNPDRFCVNEVSRIMRVSPWQARIICRSAVRQGLFEHISGDDSGDDFYRLIQSESTV